MRRHIITAVFLSCFLLPASHGATWYVSESFDPDADGSTNHPFYRIQDALDAATNDDIVTVLPGLYTGDGNKNLDFLGKAIRLQSEQGASNTVIDCEGNGRGFHFSSGETTNSVVSGFRIQNVNTAPTNTVGSPGDPVYLQYFNDKGSAIVCVSNSSPVIENCEIVDNQAMTYRFEFSVGTTNDAFYLLLIEADGQGGALYCDNSSPVIRDCFIGGNYAGINGGGLYLSGCSNVVIENCTISGNHSGIASTKTIQSDGIPSSIPFHQYSNVSSDGSGGGIFAQHSEIAVRNCILISNSTGTAGGGLCLDNSSAAVSNCTMTDNMAVDFGGGLSLSNASSVVMKDVTISENISGYLANLASSSIAAPIDPYYRETHERTYHGAGGGIYSDDSNLILDTCHVDGNQTGTGGGGIYCVSNDVVVIAHCTINANTVLDNMTSKGGGVCFIQTIPAITGSSFEGNAVGAIFQTTFQTIGSTNDPFSSQTFTREGRGLGGGIYLGNGSASMVDSLVLSNGAAQQGGGIYCAPGTSPTISNCVIAANYVSDNTDQGLGGGIAAMQASPMFLDCMVSSNSADNALARITLRIGSPPEPFFQLTTWTINGGCGGGFSLNESTAVIENSSVEKNMAGDRGGGLFCASNSSVSVLSSTLRSNHVDTQRNKTTIIVTVGSIYVVSNSIVSSTEGDGGAIHSEFSSLNLEDCHIEGNIAGGRGGGIFSGLGASLYSANCLFLDNETGPVMTNETFTPTGENTITTLLTRTWGGLGAGYYGEGSTCELQNVTFYGNRGDITNDGVVIAAFYVYDNKAGVNVATNPSFARLVNTIVWSNRLSMGTDTAADVTYSCIEGGFAGEGNFADNPELTPVGRLQATSPCIDAGTDSNAPPTDLDGEARWDDSNHSNIVSIVDVGADEFVDTDSDAIADYWELDIFGDLETSENIPDGDGDGLDGLGEYNHATDPLKADTDDDQVPDGWELRYGLDPRIREMNEDPDLDAYLNFDEYIADTDPLDGTSYFYISEINGSEAFDKTLMFWLGATGRVYEIDYAIPPINEWVNVTNLAGIGSLQSHTNSSSDLAEMYRLRVRLP